jgi:hypothetical protein
MYQTCMIYRLTQPDEEIEIKICEFAAAKGVTIDFVVMQLQSHAHGSLKKETRQKHMDLQKEQAARLAEYHFRLCLGKVLFYDQPTIDKLLEYDSTTTPYHAVFTRTDWELALILVQKLANRWNLPAPYAQPIDIDFLGKRFTHLQVHGADQPVFEVKDCVIDQQQLDRIEFPTYIKYDYGVSASAGRGGECYRHLSVALDRDDLLAKLPVFCTPAFKQFAAYAKPPEVIEVRVSVIVCDVVLQYSHTHAKPKNRNKDRS